MNRGDKLWVNVDGSWQEASYEFRVENNEPLGQHSVMLTSGAGRRVVCSCCTRLEEPPKPTADRLAIAREWFAAVLAYVRARSAVLPDSLAEGLLSELDAAKAEAPTKRCPDCYDGSGCLPGGCGVENCARCALPCCPTCGGSCEVPNVEAKAEATEDEVERVAKALWEHRDALPPWELLNVDDPGLQLHRRVGLSAARAAIAAMRNK